MIRWICALLTALIVGAGSVASAQPNSAASDVGQQIRTALEAVRAGDIERAVSILRPLARAGEAAAQHNLGVLFVQGLGVNQDFFAAEALFRMAAEQGYPSSLFSLGLMFAHGEGVPRDLIEAYKWLTLAVRKMESEPEIWASQILTIEQVQQSRDKLSPYLTPEERQVARSRADEWPTRSWASETAALQLDAVKTVRDYHRLCQPYSDMRVGIRQVYPRIAEEAVEGRTELLTCITFIESSRVVRTCDAREPILSELIYYTSILNEHEQTAKLPADGAVALALVIGKYCGPSEPLTEQQEGLHARLRQSYREQAGR